MKSSLQKKLISILEQILKEHCKKHGLSLPAPTKTTIIKALSEQDETEGVWRDAFMISPGLGKPVTPAGRTQIAQPDQKNYAVLRKGQCRLEILRNLWEFICTRSDISGL